MKIRHIEIKNFRGIKALTWAPSEHVNCLIGAGDAGKTTIIDAIDLTLSSRYQATFDDSDFFEGNYNQAIEITITLGDLPENFKAISKYGAYTRGWDAEKKIIADDPDEGNGLEYVLSVRLTVDRALEPKWSLYKAGSSEDPKAERSLTFEDRQIIVPTRLGVYTDRHLAWGRQSILTRLSGNACVRGEVLAEASRTAREQFRACEAELFKEIVTQISEWTRPVGVKIGKNIAARLDVQGVSLTSGGISLHDGDIPLRLLGAGSARLLIAALQDHAAACIPFVLIDEVEHGLEPHRISRLLRYLKSDRDGARAQLFMTTHSPVVLEELDIDDLAVIRRDKPTGKVTAISAKTDIAELDSQAPLRSVPSSYLARSVLVCEGKTEEGLARGLDLYWTKNKHDPFATAGVVAMSGGKPGAGKDRASQLAKHFRKLQYHVALFMDNDEDPDDFTILAELDRLGVKILRWEKGKASEDVLFQDIDDAGVKRIVELLKGEDEATKILEQFKSMPGTESVSDWNDLQKKCADAAIRVQLGACAKKHRWIKTRMSLSELIGLEVLGPNLETLEGENAACMTGLRVWVDDDRD